MIVDDDHDIREVVGQLLRDCDYAPIAAKNGRDAIDQLHAMDEKPCLILLDLMMPVMNGYEFREAQHADADLCDIPVVVMSAHRPTAAQARELRITAILRKPFSVQSLLRAVATACDG
jgi:CheY-like chemotaxis protein